MANYCFSEYRVEGKKEKLEELMKVINHVNTMKLDVLNMETIMTELGVLTPEFIENQGEERMEFTPEGIGLAGDWLDAKIEEINGIPVLCFCEEYKCCASENMETLATLPGWEDAITGVYRYSEEPGCDIYEVSDSEGKYFPEKYRVHFCDKEEDDHFEKCLEEKAIIDRFRQFYPEVAEDITLEQLVEKYGYEQNEDVCFFYDEIEGATGMTAQDFKKIAEAI